MTLEEKAKYYALKCHTATNHKYDGQPYEGHLQRVVDVANRFLYLTHCHELVLAACWTHDVIEDCRQTYNDVKEVLDHDVAEIVYALTNEKGRNRKERANSKYYEGIRKTPFAMFVKICDRIANFEYSIEVKSKMADLYAKESNEFTQALYHPDFKPMFDYLNELEYSLANANR